MRELTPAQKKTLWGDQGQVIDKGYIKLTARPGTGKTHTLTHYCIDLARQWSDSHAAWQGMSILSYTNVAKREIEKRISEMEIGYEILNYPHYIGTLDSFINNYIFLPFGARLMGCSERPTLIGEPFSSGKSINQTKKGRLGGIGYFDHKYYYYHSSYGLDGRLFLIGAQKDAQTNGAVSYTDTLAKLKFSSWVKVDGTYSVHAQKVHDEKQERLANGYATQADANYFAYRLLTEFGDIRDMLIARFPCLVVDEAQDMTEIQHAIVDILCSSSPDALEACILIGDDAQAIYEWNTARPDLFTNKEGFVSRELSETFRCSENICNLLNKLDNTHPLTPAGKNKTYKDGVIGYDWGSGDKTALKDAVEKFVEAISVKQPHDDSHDYLSVAVLARSKKLASYTINAYLGVADNDFGHFATFDNETTKDFLRIAYYLNGRARNVSKAFKAYETYWGNKHELKNSQAVKADIGTALFAGEDYRVGDFRRKLFGYLDDFQGLTSDMLNVSDFSSATLKSLVGNGFPDIDNIIADAKGFAARNDGDASLESLFGNVSDERMPHIVKAVNGQTVHVTIGTIHSVKGETYDGVFYLSKDMTEFCKDVCPTNARGKKTRDWRDIIKHDILKCESKRLLYVALSRAAQVLWLVGSEGFITIAELDSSALSRGQSVKTHEDAESSLPSPS